MKKSSIIVSLAVANLMFADSSYKLSDITISSADSNYESFINQDIDEEQKNSDIFLKNGIDKFSKNINISPFKVVEMAPSVNFTTVDTIGSNESSFHDSIRVRGRKQTGPGGVRNFEDIPIGGNPGGTKSMFDIENISQIDLYKGYIPVDKSLGFSNLVGKVNLLYDRPTKNMGAKIAQTVGSDSFSRTFLRVDSGKIDNSLSSFLSISKTISDKNRGEGELSRNNGSVGILYMPNDNFTSELFVTYNKDKHHNYYNLNYAEAQDIDTNFDKDFTKDSTTSKYFDYNKQSFEDVAVITNFEYIFEDNSKVTFKPYFMNDTGYYMYASGANVIKWNIDHDLFGSILKYEKSITDSLNAKIGYWYHKQLPPGPPVSQQKYSVGANGLNFTGWAVLADNDYHEFNSPFIELNGKNSNFKYSLGVRYLNFKLGELKSYTNGTDKTTSSDYDKAIANGILDESSSAKAKYFREFLPSFYLGYDFTNNLTTYFDYSKTHGLDVNLFPTFIQNRANFVAKGVTLQKLWDKLELEMSDNFDIGVKHKIGNLYLNPNIYLSMVKNKQARVFDSEYGVTYPANIADAMLYGGEIMGSLALNSSLNLYISLSYNQFYFEKNLKTTSNNTINSKDKQVPDAPKYMSKMALTYKAFGFEFTPMLKYTSKRYGDVLNTEEIDSSTIVDLDISYRKKGLLGSKYADFGISLTNIFDSKYISTINTADDALAATTSSASYQSGAPFGAYANVTFKF